MKALFAVATLLVLSLTHDVRAQEPSSPAAEKKKTWQLIPAGQLPAGNVFNETRAATLAGGDYSLDTSYLTGSFVVTAHSERQAVLRPLNDATPLRVLVEYPPSINPPEDGTRMVLDASRALQIMTVRQPREGQVIRDGKLTTGRTPTLIFARQIVRP